MKALLILAFIATTAWAADPFPTRIPDKLALCYVNKTVSDRYRRMPASIDNLIALIRKVEAHPETALWSMGKMASTLIHRFRYDGIVDIPNAGSDVVPVVNERVESDKYKLQWKLVPGTANDFPESSLTLEEQCSLHWMLSWTVNHTVRAEDKRPSVSRSLGARELDNHGEHDDHEEHHEEKKDNSEEEANATSGEKSEEKVDREPEETPDEDFDAPEETPDEPPEETDDSVPEETPEEVPEEEGIPEESESEGAAPEQTDESTDDDSFNADFGAGDSDADDDSSSFWKRKRRDTEPKEMATQPLEMGIVHTKYGTVAAGSVLMGIAAGSEPQSAKLEDLLKDPALELSQSSMERIVESIWVATLAGDIAQTALLRTSKNMPSFGPNGVWNSTYCPREYKLAESEHSMLTNAEFYGGIDGLLMAKRMGTIDSTSYLKLSSLLEMYYSETGVHGDTKYRACNRLTNYKDPSVIDQNQLKEQSLNAALVLYSRGIEGAPTVVPGVKPADQIGRYVNTTISNIDRFINDPNNVKKDFTECKGPYVQPDIEPIPATYTDLTFVFDELADAATLEKQKELAATLASLLDIQAGGSRMEVASGKDGAAFFTLDYTKNRAELACKIASLPLSYKERRIGDALDGTRKRILTERSSEKTNKVAGANTRAIMFFTTTSITNEKEKMKSVIMNMLKEMPDVHLMFATLANPEELRPYAASFDKDIIRMNLYTKYSDAASDITKRLASVGARLPYSECKDISASSNATEDKYVYTAYLNPHSVQYFRIGTEHFFSSNDLYLRFKSMYGVAKFCVSTKNERPSVGDTCKSATAAGETVEFKFSQLCNKPEPTQCSNIYVAAASLNIDDNTPCADKNCHTPDQVQFTYTHKGMRCNSATAGAVVSHLTLVAAFLLALFLKN